ncbi:MAG: RdgB/HAM1 family non-canonical purine NTP pyrophosphatase [Anaerohalosphaeraceae bacterium]
MNLDKPAILVATTNPGKLAELTAMLGELAEQVLWKTLADFPHLLAVPEDGETFAANARKKALGYARGSGLLTLADDSGLVIDALGGKPGVHSARFAAEDYSIRGEHPDRKTIDRLNYEKVLRLLKGVPTQQRTARFVCCLCLADAEQVLLETKGTVEGFITEEPLGENGFGYDPIFWLPSLNKTAAQLPAEEKNRISHRAQAVRNFKPLLENLLRTLRCR